jgi:hypothetical protein
MSLTARSLLALLPIVAILGALWFGLLSPARAEVTATEAELVQATSRRDSAVAAAAQAEQARQHYPRDYASLARLARAVPADEDVAALVRGLDSLARANRLDVRTIALSEAESAKPAAASAPDAAASDGAGAGGEKAGGKAGSTPPAGNPAAAGTDAAGTDGAAVAQAPAGAAVGSAGLLTMPFTFTAEGTYLPLQRFLRALHARAKHAGERVKVNGRLLTIDGFSYVAGREGFPQLSAIISATAYLEPDPGGIIDRSTPQAPATALMPATAPLPLQGAAG